MKTFVFFVGGTGARVMRALTMMLASGVNIGASNSIVPILIDYDVDNHDKTRSEDIIKSFQYFQKMAKYDYSQTGDKGGFFFSRMEEFRCFDMKSDQKGGISFGQKVGYNSLLSVRDDTGRSCYEDYYKFIRTLYNDSQVDPPTELNLNLERGFKGNPNIGTVVFKEFLDSDDFKNLEFAADDRFFIVGSIFGGTGSSCLPKIVEDMRRSTKPARQNAVGGACIVLPYYSLKQNDQSSISSEMFKSKTKAALDYYNQELNKKLQAIYYIGYDDIKEPYPLNVDGGKDQRNDAHLVELLASMSVVEFIKRNSFPETETVFHEYSVDSGLGVDDKIPEVANLDLFGADINSSLVSRYIRDLCSFALFCSFYRRFIANGEDLKTGFFRTAPAYITRVGDRIRLDSEFGQKFGVDTGFAMKFEDWVDEMSRNNSLKFQPFDFSKGIDDLICKAAVKKKYKNLAGTIREELANIFENIQVKNIDNEAKFIRMAYDACTKAVFEVYGNGDAAGYEPINK